MRYFSLEEAESLIPRLEETLGRVLALKGHAEQKVLHFHRQEKNPKANPVDLLLARSQADFLVSQIEDELSEIAKLGCMPKGLEPCLVDFPHRLCGREVYLCWKYGEKEISHYHGPEDGFAGRKPLPSEFACRDIED